ncbi:hypothetical protein CHS0354_000664 [Potamilus streckersoni]|uniref:Alanine--tRNA ligase n=1 Tax=Potamilus streckersoni TaxID=2493646 RepID=A0AAE0T7Z5_9BIVA|nr:hypothetical protein CHS0354_000664 [Potamilus streckersoni]
MATPAGVMATPAGELRQCLQELRHFLQEVRRFLQELRSFLQELRYFLQELRHILQELRHILQELYFSCRKFYFSVQFIVIVRVRGKGHMIIKSAPCIPDSDPTLLFVNSGMNQFKDVFLGKGSRPYRRVANSQKCIRVSGKHNDLDDVGRDTYHHTFFEMLGNWSFNDYYKSEAIVWAWELLTEVWRLPKERLYATVYEEDEEAEGLWKELTDINPSHIKRFGKKDNFWEMGETGPCGPCSEIHIDLTKEGRGGNLVNMGSPEVIEIWNLVFIQYNRNEAGQLELLPQKHVDTGMGFERVTAVLQGRVSNYDSDIFQPLFAEITDLTGKRYSDLKKTIVQREETDVAFRVVADHIRTLSFAIADGAMPSNEGRGYVLRRILRRAIRFAHLLRAETANEGAYLFRLVQTLANQMRDVYPELYESIDIIQKTIKVEEESFLQTLERGLMLFGELADVAKRTENGVISGKEAFKLYDTFGFPIDLTMLLAREKQLSVDEGEFDVCMEEQRNRARMDRKKKHVLSRKEGNGVGSFMGGRLIQEPTVFCGYECFELEATIVGWKGDGNGKFVQFDRTPFYAEGGGQVGDKGTFETEHYVFEILDTQKRDGVFLHYIEHAIEKSTGDSVPVGVISDVCRWSGLASVDKLRRERIAVNHTATHLIHSALRLILGKHVQQKGSLVNEEKLRFDFSHFEKIHEAQLNEIEWLVNEKIRNVIPVKNHVDILFDEAKKMGALAFFGDKYGDVVRVVEIGDYSVECCGGTHVNNTGEIGCVKILGEASVSSGVRRIEVLSGTGAFMLFQREYAMLQQLKKQFGVRTEDELKQKMVQLSESGKMMQKELERVRLERGQKAIEQQMTNAKNVRGVRLLGLELKGNEVTMDIYKDLAEQTRRKWVDVVICLTGVTAEGKAIIVLGIGEDASTKYDAKELIVPLSKLIGGGGGGKREIATAGGKEVSGLEKVFPSLEELL